MTQVFVDADRAGVKSFKIHFKIKAHLIGVPHLDTVNNEVMYASCVDACDFLLSLKQSGKTTKSSLRKTCAHWRAGSSYV